MWRTNCDHNVSSRRRQRRRRRRRRRRRCRRRQRSDVMTKQHFDSAPIGFQSQQPQKQFLQIFDRPQDIGEISLLVEIDYQARLTTRR